MRKKVLRSNERDILSESLIGKSFEDAKKISGFNGFSLKIFNEEINPSKHYDIIYVVVEDSIIKLVK